MGSLGQVPAARAQGHSTEAMPEPMPYAPSMPYPSSMPLSHGSASPSFVPAAPCNDLSLPAGPGAFDDCYLPQKHLYFNVGTQALARYKPGHLPVALLGPNPLDHPIPPVGRLPVAEDVHQITPTYGWGPRATIGLLYDACAFELAGYYIPPEDASVTVAMPGQLNTFFINPPIGFEGNNGLWLNTDIITTSLRTTLGSAEANVRWFAKDHNGPEAIFGVRYFDMTERLSIFADDEGLVFRDELGRPDPTRQATYSTRVHNRILAAQAGAEWQACPCHWLGLGFWGKGAWGVNFVDRDYSLVRGDGLVGFDRHRSNTIFSQIYDLAAFVEIHLLERLRVRGGYNALWLLHVPIAQQQVDFNLQNTLGKRKDNGNVFYHGPQIELQFLF
jgi:hypothetical protein